MEHFKEFIVPENKTTEVVKIDCDLCGEEIKRIGYNVNDVEICYTVGTSYPESYSVEKTKVDMCEKCFIEKLIPWLKTQGVEPVKKQIDW
jgi:hypothetical protein